MVSFNGPSLKANVFPTLTALGRFYRHCLLRVIDEKKMRLNFELVPRADTKVSRFYSLAGQCLIQLTQVVRCDLVSAMKFFFDCDQHSKFGL